MYTRASSIRSNYTTTSTKAKLMIPQRIVAGNGSIHHYNALHLVDQSIKNNNVVNANNGNINNNWTTKSSWLFNPSPPTVKNDAIVEWQDKRNCVCFPSVYYKGNNSMSMIKTTTATPATASAPTTTTNSTNKNVLYQPIGVQLIAQDAHTHLNGRNCSCQQSTRKRFAVNGDFRRVSNTELQRMNMNGIGPVLTECEKNIDSSLNDDDDDDNDDVDFKKSVITINNIYNSCRDIHNDGCDDKFLLMDKQQKDKELQAAAIKNDISL